MFGIRKKRLKHLIEALSDSDHAITARKALYDYGWSKNKAGIRGKIRPRRTLFELGVMADEGGIEVVPTLVQLCNDYPETTFVAAGYKALLAIGVRLRRVDLISKCLQPENFFDKFFFTVFSSADDCHDIDFFIFLILHIRGSSASLKKEIQL